MSGIRARDIVKKSRYLRKEDLGGPGEGVDLAIARVLEERISPDDAETEVVIYWAEAGYKPHILNATNLESIEEISGSEMTGDWIGVRVHCYHEPNVRYAGKKTGGVRIREATPAEASAAPATGTAAPAAAPTADAAFDEDIPF